MTVKKLQTARRKSSKTSSGKKVLVLMGSPRHGGNCDLLCDEFIKGAVAQGNVVEKVYLGDLKIHPCNGCYYCTKHHGKCCLKDDMGDVLKKIMTAEVIVMATPVYFYAMSAQLKLVIDRCVARWMEIKHKDFYFIMTSAEDSPDVMHGTLEGLRGFLACLDDVQEKGIIAAKGVYQKGEVLNHPAMHKALAMGKLV
ncbi:MAG: flavodoxin family protein [Bacteriovoracaceae bacterium]|nr:flavodoxin family protein [Bacteriovoracaceae bacterium]